MFAVTDPYRVKPLILPDEPERPQVHLVFDREKAAGTPLANLSSGRFLSDKEIEVLDLEHIHDHPALVFGQIHTAPAPYTSELMRKLTVGIDLSSSHRRGFRRGLNRQQLGLGTGIGERLSQQGTHGYDSNTQLTSTIHTFN